MYHTCKDLDDSNAGVVQLLAMSGASDDVKTSDGKKVSSPG